MVDHSQPSPTRPVKPVSFIDALVPLFVLITFVALSVTLFGKSAMDGPLQVGIVLSIAVTVLILLKNGHAWDDIAASGQRGVSTVVGAIFILLAVGALIGTWNMSGTIPTLIYYGIKLISPSWFYPIAFLVCMLTSLSIGSSWTTAGTIGVGLVGLSNLIGLSPEITAGAVISGAYVGDKISPLSETTILAAQLNKVELYRHISHQSKTTLPAGLIAAVFFIILGFFGDIQPFDSAVTSAELRQFEALFHISFWNLIPLLILIFLSIKKAPPSLAVLAGAVCAAVWAVFFQSEALARFMKVDLNAISAWEYTVVAIKGAWLAMANGFEAQSGIDAMDQLLSRGGMSSMLLTIWLILVAVTFGTIVDEFGMLNKLVEPILIRVKSTARLIASVVATALGLNLATGDQYIALLLPSRLFLSEFEKRGIPPENLSRAVGDAGIVTSALIPWNSCGAYMAAVLGVATVSYLPYAMFNILSPIMSVLFGFFIKKCVKLCPSGQRCKH